LEVQGFDGIAFDDPVMPHPRDDLLLAQNAAVRFREQKKQVERPISYVDSDSAMPYLAASRRDDRFSESEVTVMQHARVHSDLLVTSENSGGFSAIQYQERGCPVRACIGLYRRAATERRVTLDAAY
jgi:hypothetical protein